MLPLGLRLTLRSGREAAVRLVVTMAAVAIGVAVLLSVLAEYHAFEATANRPSWESTQGTSVGQPTANSTLWNYSESIYKGQFIEQLDVAALGPQAPVIPGIPRLPNPGQYYASPALAALLRTVPSAELGDRFSGSQVGTIGDAALSGPNELVIVIGYTPAQLQNLPDTVQVSQIATGKEIQGTTGIYKTAFELAIVALLFPLLILITTATRLAADRREERYAALRLVGGTPRQVAVIASVEAIVGALLGVVVGIGLFLALHPAIAGISLSGVHFFPQTVTPGAWAYLAMLIGVPVAAAIASQVSLLRVQISPLGVSRKVTRPAPRAWRVIPLLVGIPLFLYPILEHPATTVANANKVRPNTDLVLAGFVLIMLGLVLGGSWLTMQVARLVAKGAHGASSLLAARRLADKPKTSFRSVSGLVLAVFVGTMIAVVAPAVNLVQSPSSDASLTNVLRANYGQLPAQDGAQLIASLQAIGGVTVIPLYTNPSFSAFLATGPKAPPTGASGTGPQITPTTPQPDDSVMSCASLQQLPVLGTCAPGVTAVQVNASNVLFTDNPLFVSTNLPLVTAGNPTVSADLTGLPLSALLVKANSADSLERARTLLTTFNAGIGAGGAGVKGAESGDLSAWQMGDLEPETFGEVAAIRNNDDNNVERVILAILVLTLLTAGCSLAVTVGGSVVERKRQFTLLRLSGAPNGSLRKTIMLESALPLVTASVVAAVVGFAVTTPVIHNLLPELVHTVYPNPIYYETMGAGLALSLLVVLVTLPLLTRITSPANARFE